MTITIVLTVKRCISLSDFSHPTRKHRPSSLTLSSGSREKDARDDKLVCCIVVFKQATLTQ